MSKSPGRCRKRKVLKALQSLSFSVVPEREHISMARSNPDGSTTPFMLPNHDRLKASTLRTICTLTGISRDEFLKAYEQT